MKPRRVIVCSLIEIVTTRPAPALSMRGTTSRATRNVPVALVSSTSRKPAGVTSQNGCGSVMNRGLTVRIPIPALLTSRSRPPSTHVGRVDRRRRPSRRRGRRARFPRSGAQLRRGGLRPLRVAAGHRDPGARLHERVRPSPAPGRSYRRSPGRGCRPAPPSSRRHDAAVEGDRLVREVAVAQHRQCEVGDLVDRPRRPTGSRAASASGAPGSILVPATSAGAMVLTVIPLSATRAAMKCISPCRPALLAA